MPENFPSQIITAQGTAHDIKPWIFLYDAITDGTKRVYIAGHDQVVPFEGQQYVPYPIQYQPVVSDSEGRLATTNITVSNAGGFVAGKLKNGELLDQECRLHLVKKNPDNTITRAWIRTFLIKNAGIEGDLVSFECGQENLLSLDFPAKKFTRNKCWHGENYGGKGCDFDTTMPVPTDFQTANPDFDITTCDLTREGGNGCEVHGDLEVRNGKPRLHPLRFGACPGIPKGPARL